MQVVVAAVSLKNLEIYVILNIYPRADVIIIFFERHVVRLYKIYQRRIAFVSIAHNDFTVAVKHGERIGTVIIMLRKEVLVNLFTDIVNAPILSVQIKHAGAVCL